ncbi:hypothetical protein Syun_009834 [Stephania yunnanensis]|uniref:Uncharacterized protein n=1 Tax=Stephania yunnanensis TaxID=152371 RepID=A0AAP0PR80_9MAGN
MLRPDLAHAQSEKEEHKKCWFQNHQCLPQEFHEASNRVLHAFLVSLEACSPLCSTL